MTTEQRATPAVELPVTQWENRVSAEELYVPPRRPRRVAESQEVPPVPSDAGAV